MSRLSRRAWMILAALAAGAGVSPPAAPGASAGDDFIPVSRTAGEPPLDPVSPVWLRLPATTVTLHPQASTPPATGGEPLAAKLRVLRGGRTLAIHIEWPDAAPARARHIGRFADAAALQWPKHGRPGPLPYVGMGHAGAPVAVWLWRADGPVETLAAEGFGTLTPQAPDGVRVRGAWKDGAWRVVFRRAFAAGKGDALRFDPERGLPPVAVAVWNGEAAERDGLKRLSAWLALGPGKPDGADAQPLGAGADAERGRRLMSEQGCAACHGFPANPARPRIGPDLGHAGGIHSIGYLRESLMAPSKVVVPGKGYYMTQDGKRISLMPPFAGTEAEREDILAYLTSLR